MALGFSLRSAECVGILLLSAGLLAGADTAFYRAELTRNNGEAAAGQSASATADIKVHVVRDLAGKIVHGYVDFSLDGPLAGSTAVSELRIAPVAGGAAITVGTAHLPQHLSGSLQMRSSAPVRSDNTGALGTLRALVEGSDSFYVSITTSQGILHGEAERSTNALRPQASEDGIWKEVDDPSLTQKIQANGEPPRFYRTFHMDPNSVEALLRAAPLQNTKAAKPVISMPMPDGQFARFAIEESPVMEPALAAKFPNFKTYRGQGIDNPSLSIRFDSTNGVLHGIISGPEDMVQIHPVAAGDKEHYTVFYQRDLPPNPGLRGLQNDAIPRLEQTLSPILPLQVPVSPPLGGTVRNYRLAIATTKGFTADPTFGGGGDGVAARMTTLTNIGTMVNMINALYERDVSVSFTLIASELSLIFDTSSNPDPGWADGNEDTMINQAQGFIDAAVGNANYDIGHVFGLSGTQGSAQGLAALGVVCNSTLKAQGVTLMGIAPVFMATPPNYSDDVEVSEHEMAHEFNADHTTNSTTAFCATERSAPTAYEVGSGSTILANAGSCPSQWPGSTDPQSPTEDVQINTDVYFHASTLDGINAYIATGGGSCFAPVTNTDTPPTVTAPANVTIPISTPFALTATGTSATGSLTYTWEELDLGTASPPEGDDGSRPLFRTFFPSASPTRILPSLTYILNNSNQAPANIPCIDMSTFNCIPGEYLPTTNRTMNFRVTVRDNFAGGGGTNSASVQVTSTSAAGPFMVTQPNTAVTWQTGSTQMVTWNVANTTAAPVNVANVNILLSIDGGNTFPTTLAANVPNNGSATITVPNMPTATARVEVQAVGNIFFDMSDANFTIVQPGMAAVTVNAAPGTGGTGTAAALSRASGQTSAAASTTDKNVVNLSFTVDGKTFTGTQTFMFVKGSTHTLSTTGSQCTSNTQSEFSHWSNGGTMSQTIKVGPGLTVYTAFFNTQFELKTGVEPAGAGTITPASGKFFADGSEVKVSATANTGYVFSYWTGIAPPGQYYPGQKALPELPNENVVMNSPKTLAAHFTEGPTKLAGIVASKSGPPTQRVWTIQVSNSGPGIANTANVDGFSFKQTYGAACTPVLTTRLPAPIGSIAPASSGSVPIDINFSGCPQNARFTVTIALSANDGRATGSIVRHNDVQ